MPEHAQNSNPLDPQRQLLAELANGLHAMAQPLTILRGAFGALIMREQVASQNRHYLDMSAKQIDRLCEMMSNLRGLVDASQSEAVCKTIDLWELVLTVLEEQDSQTQESGVRIDAATPDHAIHVLADPARTEEAVNTALRTALAVSKRNDVVEIKIVYRDGSPWLMVRNEHSRKGFVSSSDRLRLALVAADIRSQEGIFEFTEEPLCISFKMRTPAQDDALVNVTSESFKVLV